MSGCAESHMVTAEVASVIMPHTLHTYMERVYIVREYEMLTSYDIMHTDT